MFKRDVNDLYRITHVGLGNHFDVVLTPQQSLLQLPADNKAAEDEVI